MQTHILGFPRIGRNRELKKALEGYWKGELSENQLHETADELKKRHLAPHIFQSKDEAREALEKQS